MSETMHFSQAQDNFQEHLINLIKAETSECVISVHAEWGYGKTCFAKRLVNELNSKTKKGFDALYFDAWEHDFAESPLAPLVYEINGNLKTSQTDLKRFLKKTCEFAGKILLKNEDIQVFLESIKEEFEEHDITFKEVKEYIKELTSSSHSLTDRYRVQHLARKSFKSSFERLIKQKNNKLIIVIDELDRCHPDFAHRFLEDIKYLMNTKKCVFITFINEPLLEGIYKVRYGVPEDSQHRYLDKFFNYRFRLPKPSLAEMCYSYIKENLEHFQISFLEETLSEYTLFRNYEDIESFMIKSLTNFIRFNDIKARTIQKSVQQVTQTCINLNLKNVKIDCNIVILVTIFTLIENHDLQGLEDLYNYQTQGRLKTNDRNYLRAFQNEAIVLKNDVDHSEKNLQKYMAQLLAILKYKDGNDNPRPNNRSHLSIQLPMSMGYYKDNIFNHGYFKPPYHLGKLISDAMTLTGEIMGDEE